MEERIDLVSEVQEQSRRGGVSGAVVASLVVHTLIAIYLLMPELRADLASYWQRVVLKNGVGAVNVA